MSEPIHIYNVKMLDAVTMAANRTSEGTNLETTVSCAVQVVWSGGASPVGTIALEASNDDVTYTQIDESVLPVSGNSGSHMINIEKPAYSLVRVVYTRTSGAGNLTVIINGKRG